VLTESADPLDAIRQQYRQENEARYRRQQREARRQLLQMPGYVEAYKERYGEEDFQRQYGD
jgi:hypothetical protein